MRIGIRHLLLGLAALGVCGMLFAWSGLFNVAASSGHWPITDWFLHWVMRNSVRTHALGIETPPLDDDALVHRGAGHFASGCAPCHGAPGEPRPAVMRGMTPPPPPLGEQIDLWQPDQLFWIVRHGVKYTGMPAWPAVGREDEVWAVVAFLLRLPDLDGAGYRELAFGPAREEQEAGPLRPGLDALVKECARCHGMDGAGRGIGAFPQLGGQSELYLAATLRAFAEARRASGIMHHAASRLDEQEIAELAAHYAAYPRRPSSRASPTQTPPGERIAREGLPAKGVPACIGCHGGNTYPAYPTLAGQHASYLESQLMLLKSGDRGGTAYSHLMETIASRLSEAQIADLAAYFAALPPAPAAGR